MILSPYSHLPSAFRACIKVSQTMLGLPRYLKIIRDQHSTWQVWLGRLSKVWFLMEGGTGLHHTPGHPETDRSRLCRAAAVTMISEVNVTSWQPEQDSHCPFWRLALPSSRCQMWEGKCCIICRESQNFPVLFVFLFRWKIELFPPFFLDIVEFLDESLTVYPV